MPPYKWWGIEREPRKSKEKKMDDGVCVYVCMCIVVCMLNFLCMYACMCVEQCPSLMVPPCEVVGHREGAEEK